MEGELIPAIPPMASTPNFSLERYPIDTRQMRVVLSTRVHHGCRSEKDRVPNFESA